MLHFPQPTYTADPRSLADLQSERAYLLGALQDQNDRATYLLRRVVPLEEMLRTPQESKIHRATKKQVGWHKHQVKQCTRQEKAILVQLNQVSQEIQSRERWCQVEHVRRLHLQAPNNLNMQSAYEGIRPTSFNPLVPEFQPQGTMFPQWISQQPQQQYVFECPASITVQREQSMDQTPKNEVGMKRGKTARPPMLRRRSSVQGGSIPRASTDTPHRRLSLPDTPTTDMWLRDRWLGEDLKDAVEEVGDDEFGVSSDLLLSIQVEDDKNMETGYFDHLSSCEG